MTDAQIYQRFKPMLIDWALAHQDMTDVQSFDRYAVEILKFFRSLHNGEYVIFSVRPIAEAIGCSRSTIRSRMKFLHTIGLLDVGDPTFSRMKGQSRSCSRARLTPLSLALLQDVERRDVTHLL